MNKIHFIDNLKTITQSKIFKLLNEIKDTVGNSIQIRKSDPHVWFNVGLNNRLMGSFIRMNRALCICVATPTYREEK